MTTATQAVSRSNEVEVLPEDGARANLYALLSHLFHSPPSPQLLQSIRDADGIENEDAGSRLAAAWDGLRQAAAGADASRVREEFDSAFLGVGRAPVFLYGSYYAAGSLMEKPLVALREELGRMGLARRETSFEPEDHVSALCDVMRYLILGDEATPPAGVDAQRDFFRRHIQGWYPALCARLEAAGETDFYKKVGALAREFFELEVESFDIG